MSEIGRRDHAAMTGTVAATQNSTAVVGTSTLFTTELVPGSVIWISGAAYVVASITDDLNLTLMTPFLGTTGSGLTPTVSDQPTSGNLMLNPSDVYGADATEVAITHGIAQQGWVHRKAFGTRVQWETLVAMASAPTETGADNSILPSALITITTQPANDTVTAPAAASFTVTASIFPATANITGYAWAVSTDSGATWTPLTDTGVYTGSATATLNISDSTGLNGHQYHVVISGDNGAVNQTSTAATLTVN